MAKIGEQDPKLTTGLVTQAVNAGLIDSSAFDAMTSKFISGRSMSRSCDALLRADRAYKQASAEHHTRDISGADETSTGAKLELRRDDLNLAQTLHNAVVAKLDGQPGWQSAMAAVRDAVDAMF